MSPQTDGRIASSNWPETDVENVDEKYLVLPQFEWNEIKEFETAAYWFQGISTVDL